MATGVSRGRRGEILKTVLLEIQNAGGEDYVRDILTIVEPKLNLSEDELIIRGIMGLPKWKQSVLSYSSRQCIKAGFITRYRGLWKLTDQGKEAIMKSDEDFIHELNEKSKTEEGSSGAVMEQPSCRGLIDWFWRIYVSYTKRWRQLPNSRREGFCQCNSEKVIDFSREPELMRAFLMVGVLIDQMMFTHFHSMYSDFRNKYKYPKLHAHGASGMISPNWLVYTTHSYDKKMDWDVVSDVAEALLGGLYDWFKDNGWSEEMKTFKQSLKNEIEFNFEEVNKDKLLPIIERIEQE
jgi:hypothetical protein